MADGQTTIDHLDLGTVSRTEVLRGPASAIYGNASGGVVRFQTGVPPPVPFHQVFDIQGGENGLARLASSTSGRTGPFELGLDLTRFSYDGYRTYSTADKSFATLRGAYRGGADEIRLVGSYVDLAAENPGSLTDSVARADPTAANPFNVVQQAGKDVRQGQLGLGWKRTLSSGWLELAAFGLTRDLHNPIPVRIVDLERLAGGVRAQLDFRSSLGGRPLPWTIGIETQLQRDDRTNHDNNQGSPGALTLDQRERVTNLGMFGQIQLPVARRWSVLGGLRFDAFRFEVEDRFVSGGDPDDSGSRSMDALSPTLGALFRVDHTMSVYGNVATAFETPTTSELANQPSGAGGFNPALEPQQTVSFELGLKGTASRFRYDVALYYANVKDELIPFQVPGQPGRDFFRNAGTSRHQGIEFGVGWTSGGWDISGAYRYTDARFTDYRTASDVFDGNKIPGVAPHDAELFAAYSAGRGWYLTGDAHYSSAIPVNDANTAEAPSFVVVNARVGWQGIALGTTSLSPYIGVANVFNENYITAVAVNAFGQRFFEPGPTRAAYLGTRWGFSLGR